MTRATPLLAEKGIQLVSVTGIEISPKTSVSIYSGDKVLPALREYRESRKKRLERCNKAVTLSYNRHDRHGASFYFQVIEQNIHVHCLKWHTTRYTARVGCRTRGSAQAGSTLACFFCFCLSPCLVSPVASRLDRLSLGRPRRVKD